MDSKSWRDASGRTWTCSITLAAARRVRDMLGINLMEAAAGDLIQRMADDPALNCDILYAIHRPQADSYGVTDEQFGELLFGDTLEAANGAFLEGLIDFFPNPRMRGMFRKAIEASKGQMSKALDELETRLNSGE